MRAMTILVTGGAGYNRQPYGARAHRRRERLIVLDDLSTGFSSAVPKAAPLFVGELGDEAMLASLISAHDVDAIVHFAGSIVVPESVADPLGYYRNNTVNSRTLIEAAVKGGARHFIFSSTAGNLRDRRELS
jgi:UDP-glucose 4-epimerase